MQSISWLHGTMQCEVKSKVARPQPSSITPDPGFVVHCYSREGSGWRSGSRKLLQSHEKQSHNSNIVSGYMYLTIMSTPIPTWASTSGYRGPIADGATGLRSIRRLSRSIRLFICPVLYNTSIVCREHPCKSSALGQIFLVSESPAIQSYSVIMLYHTCLSKALYPLCVSAIISLMALSGMNVCPDGFGHILPLLMCEVRSIAWENMAAPEIL